MKTKVFKTVVFDGRVYENVVRLKLPRKVKRDVSSLMYGDGYCLPPRGVSDKHNRKLISVCNKQTTYFKIGKHLFFIFKY